MAFSEVKELNKKSFEKLIEEVQANNDKIHGLYIYKDYRIQVSRKEPLSGNERSRKLYLKRRELGLCIQCGKKVTEKNETTGRLLRYCEEHRKRESEIRKKIRERLIAEGKLPAKKPVAKKAAPAVKAKNTAKTKAVTTKQTPAKSKVNAAKIKKPEVKSLKDNKKVQSKTAAKPVKKATPTVKKIAPANKNTKKGAAKPVKKVNPADKKIKSDNVKTEKNQVPKIGDINISGI